MSAGRLIVWAVLAVYAVSACVVIVCAIVGTRNAPTAPDDYSEGGF